MKKTTIVTALVIAVILSATSLTAASTNLSVVRFEERRDVQLDFTVTSRIPGARMDAKVGFQEGQSRIEVKYDNMKPAVLFGGDVTCYVVWAVNRDGAPENLGELWVRPERDKDTLKFSTGLRNFALMITAEPYYQTERPSELVIAYNSGTPKPPVPTYDLPFDDFVEAPEFGMERLDFVRYDGKTPLDILQAEKVYEIADRLEADKYAPGIYRDASIALQQANTMVRNRAQKGAQEYARRSVASSNEAIKITLRTKQAEQLEALIARRQSQMETLEAEAASAEAAAKAAEAAAKEAEAQAKSAEARADQVAREAEQALNRMETQKRKAELAVEDANRQLRTIENDKARVEQERAGLQSALLELRDQRAQLQDSMSSLESDIQRLETEKARVLEENQRIERAKQEVENRLQSALSLVAETRASARGTILNLPDILFDLNQATLKPEAKVVMAKLAGILLIMNDLSLSIEGHTDSTGSEEYNLELSRKRAASVQDFLMQQGIESDRMKSVGYGLQRPIAENTTSDGRRKNRRVEIVVAEGQITD